ncbi:MAG TPA: aminotransferase class III-fold pyridoxal phosphate-dependent enzyme [Myxococcales bacterium LLY-WYZ-16_1]|nr:aminotransferase class III-fold pyridoxal phosphate-dependent enzyme [Myxococcales bacterium LLY-WYZ-16_1]
MNSDEIKRLCLEHTLYSWSATSRIDPLVAVRGEGPFFWDADGRRYFDLSGQMLSMHLGFGHPRILGAMQEAASKLTFAAPSMATEARARLGHRLAELFVNDVECFFFTLGGADAMENAIRIARAATGRHKILSRHRSYHGATPGSLAASGDPRRNRWPEPPGFVRVLGPDPFSFRWSEDPDETVRLVLQQTEEVILQEDPSTIAAMAVEVVMGSNGILRAPRGYFEGLQTLLRKHDILLICDEVMTGFGRTGRWFAFEHEALNPDLVTMAKGLTSSYVPLGAVGMTRRLADTFEQTPFWSGMTYNAHPFCLEVALAVIDTIDGESLVERSQTLGDWLRDRLHALADAHPRAVAAVRNVGLFGALELKDPRSGEPLGAFGAAPSPAGKRFVAGLRNRGVYALLRWNMLLLAPPLNVPQAELAVALDAVDAELSSLESD